MYYAKRNKSIRERQMRCEFTPMWNLRKKTDEYMERGKRIREGNKPQETVNDKEKTEG